MNKLSPVYGTDHALLSSAERQGKKERAHLHHSGVYVDARYQKEEVQEFSSGALERPLSMPLPLTLEALEHRSNEKSLPSWAKRASEKPQIKGTSEMVLSLIHI